VTFVEEARDNGQYVTEPKWLFYIEPDQRTPIIIL